MKLFKLLIIPLVLVLGYLTLVSYPYFFSKINPYDSLGFLSLVEEMPVNIRQTISQDRVTDKFDNHLLKGEKVMSKFKATENNFGILLFRFVQLAGIVKDSVTFRIKEEGSDTWYYEHTYRADQFHSDQYFTFGFPPISSSKGKIYIFEIESVAGTYKNGIGVSNKRLKVAGVYKYTREDLENFNKLFSFSSKKFIYVARNVNFLQNRQLFIIFISSLLFILYLKKKRKIISLLLEYIPKLKKNYRNFFKLIVSEIVSDYLLFEKKLFKPLKNSVLIFTRSKFYLKFLDTNAKKRLAIGLLIFLIAFLYRFSATLVDQLGVSLFYAGLGGQGDYDQFIRAATCAVRNFCPAILGQNFLIESSILGTFYEILGFTGGLRAYLYLMIFLSSIVATLPYLMLSRKNFLTVGGIIGSLFLATSDFLTNVALALPPDNGSLFTFSIFFIVYLLTIHLGTIRWLLFFGLMGTIDGLNKLMLLMNDLAVFILFIPVFFYEKAKRSKKFPFVRLDLKLIFYSMLPLLIFLVIYSAWEYIVQITFSTPYYLRALIEGGSTYASSTDEASMSIKQSLARGNILGTLYYIAGSYIVMQKRIIENAGLNTFLLAPILFGLLFVTFRKPRYLIAKLISVSIFASFALTVIVLFRGNYLDAHEIGQYVYAWPDSIYINVFIATSILFLFILNFKYQAFKLAFPILPYVIMLIFLTKNAPWVRLLVHVIVWSVILFSFLIDWILSNADKRYLLKRVFIGPIILALFILFYTIPKASSMVANLYEGINIARSEVNYLRWVNSELPREAIVLLGGKSDLVTAAQELKRPVIYNTTWSQALLIRPKEIPGLKSTDFAILAQLKINEIPGVTPSDFNIIRELSNRENFRKNKYLILEDDIALWRGRMEGIADNLFSTSSTALLDRKNYSIQVYKSNPVLKKAIYELNLKDESI